MTNTQLVRSIKRVCLATAGLGTVLAAPAMAQPAADAANVWSGGDIIVTARKRAETEMDVPAAITALGTAQIDQYATRDLGGLATRVPSLQVAQTTGGAGGSIGLRGVTSSATNPSIDQAVSLNIDGIQLSSGHMIRLGQVDLQQIEVLKGPQALFFGKNSPGGVISYTTVDPGDTLEGYVRGGYEFEAREWTGEAAIGGPLTDTLGARVTVYGTTMEGDRRNLASIVPELSAFGPGRVRTPKREEIFLRGTVVYEPSDDLKVRAKYNFSSLKGPSPWHYAERIACPYGAAQVSGLGPQIAVDDCTANGVLYQGVNNPSLIALVEDVYRKEGTRTKQHLASLEINYNIVPDISVTSITGFYKVDDDTYGNSSYAPVSLLISGTAAEKRDITQELRIASDRKEWPVNFTVGAFYQDTKFSGATPIVGDAFALGASPTLGTPVLFSYTESFVDTEAYSFFGQLMWSITDTLELAGGARWSHEKKKLRVNRNPGFGGGPFIPGVDSISFNDTSPEVTLSWRPSREIMVFGAFRNGFKSGGFNTSGNTATLTADPSYQPEDARGFELGVKVQTGALRFSTIAYTYKYKNMQVSTFDPVRVIQLVTNAASSTIKGIEAEVNWAPPQFEGLNLHGNINYNHARYDDFLVGCYTGQTVAEGCNVNLNSATGRYQQQDFAGRQLYLAPDWTGSVGFTYSQPISNSLKMSMSGDAIYKGRYYADLEQVPHGRQDESWMFNASVRVADIADRWEFAVMGENLTEVYRSSLTSQISLTGISSRTGTNTPGGLADLNGQINRGRQVRAQFTYRFR